MRQILEKWEVLRRLPIFILIMPFSILVCLRDRLLNKVVKTHIEFEKNKNTFSLKVITNDYFS